MKVYEIQSYKEELSDDKISLLTSNKLYRKPKDNFKNEPYFNSGGLSYIDLGNREEYKVDNFNLILIFDVNSKIAYENFVSIQHNTQTGGNTTAILARRSGNSDYMDIKVPGAVILTKNEIKNNNILIISAINGNGKVIFNNVEYNYNAGEFIGRDMNSYLCCISNSDNTGVIYNTDSNIKYFKYNELDSNGNVFKELINLDFNQTTGTTVPNIAKDAPLNSDGIIVPNGQTDNFWWISNNYKKMIKKVSISALSGIIEDKFGNTITNNGITVINDSIRPYMKTTTTSYLDVDFNINKNSYTIAQWVYFNFNQNGYIFNSDSFYISLRLSYNYAQFLLYQTDGEVKRSVAQSVNNINSGYPYSWINLISVADGKYLKLYINGIKTGGNIEYDGTIRSSSTFRINESYQGTGGYHFMTELYEGNPPNSDDFAKEYYYSTKNIYNL